MQKRVTIYIVCNSTLCHKLKSIEGFKMDLGTSLTDSNNRINPQDTTVQYHHLHHNEIIFRLGWIGSLAIYSYPSCPLNAIYSCYQEHRHLHTIDPNKSLYTNLNAAIEPMIKLSGIAITKEEPIKKTTKEVVKKPLKEMTEAERLAWARNLK